MPPLGQLVFNHPDRERNSGLSSRFNEEVLQRGLIIFSVFHPGYSHSEADIAEALKAMGEAIEVMKAEGLFDC